MNQIVYFRKCSLSNEELMSKVDFMVDSMYEGPNAGKVPDRHIPARPNDDFDLLVGELIMRFQEAVKKDKE